MSYNPENGVKPRYDGGGSEFGLIHRHLPPKCGMFDIDRISATATLNLELKQEDVAFMEYRTKFDTNEIEWKAMFEIKRNNSEYVQKQLSCNIGSATWAQMKLCEQIGARYFIVIATEGRQPFIFYEISSSGAVEIGVLDYIDKKSDGAKAVIDFWRDKLKIL